MKTILVLGAGLSASSLIRYLLENSTIYDWEVRIVDRDIALVNKKINGHSNGVGLAFDALDSKQRMVEIKAANLVISMLPARFHIDVANDCVEAKTNLITPSYISPEIRALDAKAKEAGIIIMNEIGVDPGIDHMSAMKIVHKIQADGGKLLSFKSFCGGLIAPECDNNPWNYKFTWNPRNVVLAGQGGASCFLRNGVHKYIPYNRLYERVEKISIEGYGDFVGYANRDSLSYRATYGIDAIPTIFRGTLRRPGYCRAWNVFIELGMTDDSFEMVNTEDLSPRSFLNSFLPFDLSSTVEHKFKTFLRTDRMDLFERFEWLGLFKNEPIVGLTKASPAQVLQKILEDKLYMEEGDKDMLVMIHEIIYELNGESRKITSHMVNIGEDNVYTSMSNTVGIPTAICSKMILNGELNQTGVTLPVQSEVYEPILKELETFDIRFIEKEELL
jgi:saccharopine dehydrogenase-like NADP-dependent oxidoreductase